MSSSIIYAFIGFLLGGIISGAVVYSQVGSTTMPTSLVVTPRVDGHDMSAMKPGESMTMTDMVSSLNGKQGDAFDKLFISGMIEHHQGAIDMAKQAKVSAKHEEIKQLADEIISAQTYEIKQMQDWQKSWGY